MSQLPGAIGFGILSIIVLYLAKRAHYFALPQEKVWESPIRWIHVVTVFVLYFTVVILIAPVVALIIRPMLSSFVAAATWLNFLTSFIILAGIALYSCVIPRQIIFKIWKRDSEGTFFQDARFALLTFVIAFPIVIFLNEFFDFILQTVFHVQELPDQLAVRFLKMTFAHPRYFFLSIVTIVFFAPLLEELLFRGFLQSFIRKHLGPKFAILITAICFSGFHYSPEQGISNISIIGSLFALALFLGFTYEKQGSLAASMILHGSFNLVSVVNLYFVGGFPKAL